LGRHPSITNRAPSNHVIGAPVPPGSIRSTTPAGEEDKTPGVTVDALRERFHQVHTARKPFRQTNAVLRLQLIISSDDGFR
jgi:hypothetical protein